MPAAKINAPSKRPKINLAPLQQPHPPDEQQLPSFFSSDIEYPPALLCHSFRKTSNTKNNDQNRHEEQWPDLADQIKKPQPFKNDPPDDL
jgi:hypothetical protein